MSGPFVVSLGKRAVSMSRRHLISKKILLAAMCAFTACAFCFGLAACSGSDNGSEGASNASQASGVPSNFVNQVSAGSLSASYPDELTVVSEEADQAVQQGDRTLTESAATLANEDYTLVFSLTQYEGVTFEEARDFAESMPEQVRQSAGTVGEEWGDGTQSFLQGLQWDEIASTSIDGRDAFIVSCSIDRPDGEARSTAYFISIGDDTVGIVTLGFMADEVYESNRELIDGFIASLKVS